MDRAEEKARWQEAQELIERHGDGITNVYVTECEKLAEVADWDGIGRWHDMIYRCEHLRHSPPIIPFAPIALARAGFIDETGRLSHE
jgi:hypothetical protein